MSIHLLSRVDTNNPGDTGTPVTCKNVAYQTIAKHRSTEILMHHHS